MSRIGDYRIERTLASEEIGVLYLGTHVILPRQAVVKVIHPDQANLKNLAVQLLREACMVDAMFHPAVPRVYECGILPDRRPWAAFEWIDGETLASTLAAEQLGIADIVVFMRDVADALSHAHERGVVHRRLTADALVRTPGRSGLRIRHWSEARPLDADRITVDARDDVYALGVIAFRALTGVLPTRAVAASDLCPHAPRELTSLVDHMLASDPHSRPTSAGVRDRASWLARTMEHVPLDAAVPVCGVDGEVPTRLSDLSAGVRIRR
ncbi:MAG: protein kinase [Kofleriaceae bacterium]